MSTAEDLYAIEEHTDRATWLAARRRGLGGSDAGVLWGVSDRHTLYTLWADKRHGKRPEDDTDPIWRLIGHEFEPALARVYGQIHNRGIINIGQHTILRSRAWPWMTATLDRVGEARERPGYGVVECKVRSAPSAWWWWQKHGIPADIWAQVQHDFAVTGWRWGAVVALLSGRPWVREIERDDAWIEDHVERCHDYWYRYVLGDEVPPRDGRRVTLDAVKLVNDEGTGETVKLNAEAEAWVDTIRGFKAIKEAHDKAESELRTAMGSATFGILPSGKRIKLTDVEGTETRKGYRRLIVLKK